MRKVFRELHEGQMKEYWPIGSLARLHDGIQMETTQLQPREATTDRFEAGICPKIFYFDASAALGQRACKEELRSELLRAREGPSLVG